MATYTPDTSNRYCNWTYVRECDLPKGKKLLSCSRCNEVFYIDRESQTLHWKVHRKTCCPVAGDDARIREEGGISSLRDCWDILHWILQDPMRRIKGRLFLYAFQRLKAYLFETDRYVNFQTAIDMQTQEFVLNPLGDHGVADDRDNAAVRKNIEFIDLLFSIPGFASYFLSEDILLSNAMKEKKDKGEPVPSREYYVEQGLEDPETKYDPRFHLPLIYWSLITSVLSGACLQFSRKDQYYCYKFGQGDLAAAVVRHQMVLWQCPYTRASFPSLNQSQMNAPYVSRSLHFYVTFMPTVRFGDTDRLRIRGLKKEEIVPGMSAKQMLKLFISEDTTFFAHFHPKDASMLVNCVYLNHVANQENGPFSSLSPDDRLQLLDMYQDWDAPELNLEETVAEQLTMNLTTLQEAMLFFILGDATNTLLKMCDVAAQRKLSSSSSTPLKQGTIDTIMKLKKGLMDETMPKVMIYLNAVEPQYLRLAEREKFKAQPFPEDLLTIISELALKNEFHISPARRISPAKKPKSKEVICAEKDAPKLAKPNEDYEDTFYEDNGDRSYADFFGRNLILLYLQSPRYQGKTALCVGSDSSSNRIIVWPLEIGNEILVDPTKCEISGRFRYDDCIRESWTRTDSAEDDAADNNAGATCGLCHKPSCATINLPCTHPFCSSCVAQLRPPRDDSFQFSCPTCNESLSVMFKKLVDEAVAICDDYPALLTCTDHQCQEIGRHNLGEVIIAEEVVKRIKVAIGVAKGMNDISGLLRELEAVMSAYTKAAVAKHRKASPVKHHRDLFRKMVCKIDPRVRNLRRQYDDCRRVRAICGGVDSVLEALWMKSFGSPLLSQVGATGTATPNNVTPTQLATPNNAWNRELPVFIEKNLDDAWYYIRSFGVNYQMFLTSFANVTAKLGTRVDKCILFTEKMQLTEWTARRLDALEDLFRTRGLYGKPEAAEASLLIQILFNITFLVSHKRYKQVALFGRIFGPEYLLREAEGAISPHFIPTVVQIVNQIKSQEGDEPDLSARRCHLYRTQGRVVTSCKLKESRHNEFLRCKCKRVAYCSPTCKAMDEANHAPQCAEICRVQKALGKA